MSAPPQARPNTASQADRNGRIFQLKIAGLTERAIAAEVGLSPTRVHEILVEEIGARVGPPAEEYVALREAELADLWSRAYRIAITADDPADRIKAIETAKRINESRRKLRGADAPESIAVTHEANLTLTADLTTAVILSVMDGLQMTGPRRDYALALAQHVIDHDGDSEAPGAPPVPVDLPAEPYRDPKGQYVVVDGVTYYRPRELPTGTSDGPSPARSPHAWPTGPDDPPRHPHDPAEAVLDALRDFEETYGGLDAEDDA